MNLDKDPESWARVSPAAVLSGSEAQRVNVLTMAKHDIAMLAAEVERMKSALQTIERMQTYPSHSMNTVTLCAARAIAREGLGVPKE